MPKDRNSNLDLDERTARLGREWFAEIRGRERAEQAKEKAAKTGDGSGDGGLTDGLWDWLSGDGDADGSD